MFNFSVIPKKDLVDAARNTKARPSEGDGPCGGRRGGRVVTAAV